MARYSILMVTLFLLILNATQGYSAELDYTKSAFLSTMKGVKNAMECFSSAAHENRASLNSLTEMVLQLKDQISQHNRNNEAMKKESTDLQRVATLIRDVEDLKKKLETKDTPVVQLTQDKAELKIKFDNYCGKQVQDLDKRLHESLQRAQELEATVQELNQTAETQKKETDQSTECNQPQLQAVKAVVQRFNSNKDLNQLQSYIMAVMDPGSKAYTQLQSISSDSYFMYYLGINGHLELATLLLCAGLNADTTDSTNYNILHGAAAGGKAQLVKFLLDHGATVDVPGEYQYTALTWAAYSGHLDVVKLLVQAGASTTATEYTGRTPLEVAESYGRTAVAQYLQQIPH